MTCVPSKQGQGSAAVMPSCRELADAAATGDTSNLGWVERLRHLFHAWRCPPCRHYRKQLESIGDAAREAASEADPCAEDLQAMQRRCLEKLRARTS